MSCNLLKNKTIEKFYDSLCSRSTLIFYIAWSSLLLYCILNNLHHYGLKTHGIEGYPGVSAVTSLTGICFVLTSVTLPVGIILKFREKPLALWIGTLLLGSLILALSDSFGIQNPYVDDPFMNEPFKMFLSSWSSWTTVMTFFYAIPLGIVYGVLRWRNKQAKIEAGWNIAGGILLILTIALIVSDFMLSHT